MGGRGASSSGGDGLPAKFHAALGRKGKPRDIDTVLSTANKPRYNDDMAYRINCQRCVYAYEMQRRGYKVQALPNSNPKDGFSQNIAGGYREVFKHQKWERLDTTGRTAKTRTIGLIWAVRKKFDEWPSGSRAVMTVMWQRGKTGHAFNVEKINGEVRIVDAQSGRNLPLSAYLSKAKSGQVDISRVDHLTEPTDGILKCVKPLQGGK